MKILMPQNPFHTYGGVHVPHRKHTCGHTTEVLPIPQKVTIPMSQHIGAPCTPLVKVGDEVLVGQKIADSDKFISAPIHASISGKVTAIDKILMTNGEKLDAIMITSDGNMTVSPDIKPPVIHTFEDFIAAIRESGLVGLGGAGFPTHVKLNIPKDKKIDTLIINAAECEPYITSDSREMVENTQSVLDGIFTVKEQLHIDRVVIGIESNKPNDIKILTEALRNDTRNSDHSVGLLILKSIYPQGSERVLVQAVTGKEMIPSKLPSDFGCLIMNVSSVAFVADYLKTGMPLIKKRVTVDGSAVTTQNLMPIGTSLPDVIAFCDGYKEEVHKIILGGPMMGIAIPNDEFPIVKQSNGVLFFGEKDANLKKITACIHCGACVRVCPMHLVPSSLEKNTEKKLIHQLNDLSVMTCIECGSCSYVCPAYRPLVQAIRLGKTYVRKDAADKKEKEETKKQKEAEAKSNN